MHVEDCSHDLKKSQFVFSLEIVYMCSVAGNVYEQSEHGRHMILKHSMKFKSYLFTFKVTAN